MSCTYEKNSEANNKVYVLNQITVAALDRLAEVYDMCRDIVVKESAEGDMLFATEEDAADKLAQQQEDHALEALEECRKNMDSASTTVLSMRRRGSM